MLNMGIDAVARADPDRLAMVATDGQELSFARLAATIRAFAFRLHGAGVRQGDSVLSVVDNPAVRFCHWAATLRIGGLPVIAPARVLAEAGFAPDWTMALPDQKSTGRRIEFGPDWRADAGDAGGPEPVAEEQGAIISSSGTTGLPKIMRYPPGCILARNQAMNALSGAPAGRVFCGINLYNATGFRYAYRALLAGQAAVLVGGDARHNLARMVRYAVSELAAPPPLLADLCDAAADLPAELVPRLARIVTLGSAISQALLARTEAVFAAPVTVRYGMSEVASIAIGRPLGPDYEPGLIGALIPGVEVELAGPLTAEGFGRLRVRAPGAVRVAPYLNAEGPFDADGWMVSSDLVRLRTDGRLVIGGRADDVINTGGKGWLPELFEAIALSQPGISRVAAFGAPAPGGYDAVWLAVVADAGFSADHLAAAISGQFPTAGPIHVVALEALPLNAAGKIDRRALRARLGG